MPTNTGHHSAARHQTNAGISQPEQKNMDARLRSAWLAVPSSLHSRPEPRSAWDSAARADCPTSPWDRTIEPLRSALRAAIRTGDRDKVSAVTMRIENFMDAMKAEVLSVNPLRDEATILRVAIEETQHQGAADVAMLEVTGDPMPCRVKLERAEVALATHESSLRRVRTMVGSLLRNGIVPPRLKVHS